MNRDTSDPRGAAIAMLAGDDAPPARVDCFADEVVIDFPSVLPAVERMREAFVERERGTALCARISLSLQQAADGVTLPLDVPLRTICRTCGGRGETWSEPCGRCQASGSERVTHHVQVSVPPGVADGACFRFCVACRHDPPTRVELRVAVSS